MKQYLEIKNVHAREILDSRGNPTVEVEVTLENGVTGRASVPSGASTGAFEAIELRDKDAKRYFGKGVRNATDNVNKIIAPELKGINVLNQSEIDNIMIKEDGTANKGKFGANAVLGVSLACVHTASNALGMPLYRYIGGINSKILPVPMMNILNGGKHSDNNVNIQEFMIMPIGAKSFSEAVRMCVEVYYMLKAVLKENKYSTAIGDEGGFAPNLKKDEEALDLITEAVDRAGYNLENQFKIALDAAATEMYEEAKLKGEDGKYYFWKTGEMKTGEEMIEYWINLCDKYPIISLEDGLSEEDWTGWVSLTKALGRKIQLVGDDLFVTNTERLRKGIEAGAGNAILIKVNQIGTLTETLDAISMASKAGYKTIISHRSGETEDTTIADLAVATGAGQIKTGAPVRTDRVAKYNQLLRIEEELGKA